MNRKNNSICVIAPAKINLNLHVFNKDFDGYHFLKSKVCFIDLCDYIYISKNNNTIIKQLTSKSRFILKKETILLKTIKLFQKHFKWHKNFKISYSKNIPIGAGLGGGSADAAALILGLKYLYNQDNPSKKLLNREIVDFSFNIGSDVPSCIFSRSLELSGKGENISFSKIPRNYFYLIIYPDIKISTRKVFSSFTPKKQSEIFTSTFSNIEIKNSLITSACKIAPVIRDVLDVIKSLKKIRAYGMSGSGSSCFGIFENLQDLNFALKQLNCKRRKNWFFWHGRKKEFGFKRIIY